MEIECIITRRGGSSGGGAKVIGIIKKPETATKFSIPLDSGVDDLTKHSFCLYAGPKSYGTNFMLNVSRIIGDYANEMAIYSKTDGAVVANFSDAGVVVNKDSVELTQAPSGKKFSFSTLNEMFMYVFI